MPPNKQVETPRLKTAIMPLSSLTSQQCGWAGLLIWSQIRRLRCDGLRVRGGLVGPVEVCFGAAAGRQGPGGAPHAQVISWIPLLTYPPSEHGTRHNGGDPK